MKKDRLIITEHPFGYSISWYLGGMDGVGASLGEGDLPTEDSPDDHCVATRAVAALDPERDEFGFYWETRNKAKAALAAAKGAIANKPWPWWAVRAKMDGWRPPKGWRP